MAVFTAAVRGHHPQQGQDVNRGRPASAYTPSGRADIPIEHDSDSDLEPTVEPEPDTDQVPEVDSVEPEPEPQQPEPEPEEPEQEPEPEPEPEQEPEPGYVPPPYTQPTDGQDGSDGGDDGDQQVICEDDDQSQSQTGDVDYGEGCGGPSITATSSIFEHQVSMISVPIPAVMEHIASSNSKGGSFIPSHPFGQQPVFRPPSPQKGQQQQQSGHQMMTSNSKHYSSSSSSYSKTYVRSAVVPVSYPSAGAPSPLAAPSPSMPVAIASPATNANALPTKSSGDSGCQSTSFTYKCQMVYGPTQRMKLCEPVPVEAIPNCCSIC